MALSSLRAARRKAGLSQLAAATRLGVSQPYYSQLENGARPLPAALATQAARKLAASVSVLPLPELSLRWRTIPADRLAAALAALGYAPFAHLSKSARPMNPALVVLGVLAHADIDVRLVEAVPWLLAESRDLDLDWLTAQSRLLNLQNRLGYLTGLAQAYAPRATHLTRLRNQLEPSKLAAEGTLCRDSMPAAERQWVQTHRPAEANDWHLLTTLTREQLPYAA